MITVKLRFIRCSGSFFWVLLLLAWANGAALANSVNSASSASNALDMVEIRPGVYVHSGEHADIDEHNLGDIANIGFFVGSQSVAVIDAGASPAIAQALQASVVSVTDLPISHVILTHFHPDHALGVSAFPDSVQVVAHENYPRSVLQRGTFYLDRYIDLLGLEPEALDPPDLLITIGETITIELGERPLELTAHPVSHSDNDLSVFDPSEQVLWASDLVFEARMPSLDGSISGWLSTLDELERRFAGSLVVPGHGEPGSLESTIALQRHYLVTILGEIRAGIALNTPLSVAVEQIGSEFEEQWKLFDLHHKGNVSKAWSELEWE